MSIIENATKWAEGIAANNQHGYDQARRWGPDYDCSSLVISAYEQAGVKVKTSGATYTGNMLSVFKKCGFKDVTSSVDLKTGKGLKRGDVLLNIKKHTAIFCGNGKEVEASINEKGKAIGGVVGDQTGKEILVRSYRNYPWDKVLRYDEKAKSNTKAVSTKTPVALYSATVTARSGLNVRKAPNGSIIKSIPFGTIVNVYEENGTWARISADAQEWCYKSWLGKINSSSGI